MSIQSFETLIDFMRYGLTRANQTQLHYGHGTDNAWDDIRALILGSLNLPPDVDPLLWHARLTVDERKHLMQQINCRIQKRIPVPYLTHEAFFCGLPFYVDERVLIPRSPIAELIENQFSPWIEPDQVHCILDVCTGSGCIAIACCYAFPDAKVEALDLSPKALAVARINQEKHQVNEQLTLLKSDVFSAIQPRQQYDIIVSNPPYVGQEEMQTLPKEYLHEPQMALEAAQQGLAIIDQIINQASAYLSPHGILVVEVGNSQPLVMEKYPHLPLTWLEFSRGGDGVFLLYSNQLDQTKYK